MMRYFQAMVMTFVLASAAAAENATVPGEVTTPFPTILNLAMEWKIGGDANLNGHVAVRYRQSGDQAWRDAMPLRRVAAGESRGTRPIFHWENKHSGSIFDLRPNTEYEIELKLSDPDGGADEKLVRAKTRPVPRAPAGATVRNVTPETIGSGKPGEILLLAAGNYGEFNVPADGAPNQPIVYRSADGGAVFSRIEMTGRKHIFIEGVTIKDSQRESKGINMHNAADCVVRRCNIK